MGVIVAIMFQFFLYLDFFTLYLFQALDTLLELSASSKEQPNSYYESASSKDAQYLHKSSNSVC